MAKVDLPWLFHIPDAALAAKLAPLLFELGGVVIADPAHLPKRDRQNLVHTVTGPRPDEHGDPYLDVLIHAVDWSREVEWLPDELDVVAADVYTWADSPTSFIGVFEDVPEDAPAGVAEWLGLEPDEG